MRFPKSLISACVLAVGLLPTASTAGRVTQNEIEDLTGAFARCVEHLPDARAAGQAQQDAGWRRNSGRQGLTFYTTEDRGTMTATDSRDQSCYFGIDGLYDEDAVALAELLVTAMANGGTIGAYTDLPNDYLAAYQVSINGKTFIVSVLRIINIPRLYRGSIIILETAR